MERYDKIEYNFEDELYIPPNDSIAATDSEGYITSQQYAVKNDAPDIDEYIEEYIDSEPPHKRDKNAPRECVIVFQLAVCIILAVAAFVLKSVGGEIYDEIKTFYFDNINNSIIIEMDNDNNSNFVSDILNNVSK